MTPPRARRAHPQSEDRPQAVWPREFEAVSDVREFLLAAFDKRGPGGLDPIAHPIPNYGSLEEVFDRNLLLDVGRVFRRDLGVASLELVTYPLASSVAFVTGRSEPDGVNVGYWLLMCWFYPAAAVRACTAWGEGEDAEWALDVPEDARPGINSAVSQLCQDLKPVLSSRRYIVLPYDHPAYQQWIPPGQKRTSKAWDYLFPLGFFDEVDPIEICGETVSYGCAVRYEIPELDP